MNAAPVITAQASGAGRVLLSAKQRRALAVLARRAWEIAGRPTGETFDDWRHGEVEAEVGRSGLTDCENRHYLILRARWEAMLGNRLAATQDMLRQVREANTWARAMLDKACREAADVLPNAIGYAAGFLKNIRQTTLEAADPKQLRDAMFTIRRRAAQLRRKEGRGEEERGRHAADKKINSPVSSSPCLPVSQSPYAPVLTVGLTSGSPQIAILDGGAAARVDTRPAAGSSHGGDRGGLSCLPGREIGGGVQPISAKPASPTHLRVL